MSIRAASPSDRFPLARITEISSIYGEDEDVRIWSWKFTDGEDAGWVAIPLRFYPPSLPDPVYEMQRRWSLWAETEIEEVGEGLLFKPVANARLPRETPDRAAARARATELMRHARDQFTGMLFDVKSNVRNEGVLALEAVERKLAIKCDEAFMQLAFCADEIRRYLDPEDEPIWLPGGERQLVRDVGLAIERFDRCTRRLAALRETLSHFLEYGTPLDAEEADETDQPLAINGSSRVLLMLQAIEAVLNAPGRIGQPKNNTELYRHAAQRGGFEYRGDEANAFGKTINNNFNKMRMEVPKTPREWVVFFERQKAEKTGNSGFPGNRKKAE